MFQRVEAGTKSRGGDDAITRQNKQPRKGLTLLQLMLVMVVNGLLMSFILTAAMDGVRRADERATQALITKLEAGMTDRVDAILNQRADATHGHATVAAIYPTGVASSVAGAQRAQVIAQFDMMK